MTDINPYDPPVLSEEEAAPVATEGLQQGPCGLGGWLILVGLGLLVTPFRLGAIIFLTYVPIFTDGTWENVTTPASEYYHPLWGPLLIFEVLGNLAFIVAYLVLGYLFLRKSRHFPRTYITVAIVNVVVIALDAWASSFVLPDEAMFDSETTREVIRALVSTSIWVPYMMVSKRVRNTFVE